MNERNRSVRGYDRLARVYHRLESLVFRDRLERAREAMLGDLPRCDSALVLGDGDGRFLEQLCRDLEECRITSVDQSEQMLRLQQRRVKQIGAVDRVTFHCQDAKSFAPEAGEYDLLVTLFFLDCFSEQELVQLLPQWLNGIRPGGLFYFVDFHDAATSWQRLPAGFCLAIMHWFFRWQTGLPNRRMVDIDGVLAKQPITLVQSQTRNGGLIHCRLYRVVENSTVTESPCHPQSDPIAFDIHAG